MEGIVARLTVYLMLFSSICVYEYSCEPFTVVIGISAVVSGLLAGFNPIRCRFYECCDERWISTNFTALRATLDNRLYGQHLVIGPMMKHLKAHMKGNSDKALALSFHGWTGTGKNYVSKMVVEHMFKQGMSSKYVHLISATKEYPHTEMLHLYKDKLREKIETEVAKCPQSLFIFDEMDKMPAGLIDTLKPYMEYYDEIGGVDYRRAIFLFLSNTAGNDIAQEAIQLWHGGGDREKLTLKQLEKVIHLPALNAESGLWHSELITKNLITAFIPFLPLERKHVKQCIRDGLVTKRYYRSGDSISETKVQEIADELQYYPEGVGIFSTTGCKRVAEKIDFVMEDV